MTNIETHRSIIARLRKAENILKNEGAEALANLDQDRCNRKYAAAATVAAFRKSAATLDQNSAAECAAFTAQAELLVRFANLSGAIFNVEFALTEDEQGILSELVGLELIREIREQQGTSRSVYYVIAGMERTDLAPTVPAKTVTLAEVTQAVRVATDHVDNYENTLRTVTTLAAMLGYPAPAGGQSPDLAVSIIDAGLITDAAMVASAVA